MGWLYMRSLEGHATPKAYLDAQFTYDRDTGRSRVLASSVVGRRTYYAAVEWISAGTEVREVWGLVCLVRHNPRDRELRGELQVQQARTRRCGRRQWQR